MTRLVTVSLILVAGLLPGALVLAGPEEDRAAFVAYYPSRFPDIPFAEFANGIYAIDEDARRQWQEIEEFPPYEFAVERGEALWRAPLADESTYDDCFEQPLDEVRPSYPLFDADRDEVVTLEVAVNDCRRSYGKPPFAYDSEDLISITAFLAFKARGKTLETRVSGDQPGALAAYAAGKRFYYSKRGQLNFACSDCHVMSAGQYVRADRLSASLGHPTHFPVYRSKLGAMITLHQRFAGCVRDVRAKPFELQSSEYRNLEYFLSYMSNGLKINGPGARK
jgi:sulfur-oxidizing protein SoxA